MQTNILGKVDLRKMESVRSKAKQELADQDKLLQDELMQELAQQKTSLENLVDDSLIEKNVAAVVGSGTLRDCVEQTLKSYFIHLDGQPVTNIYEMVLAEVEAPLLEVVMRYTQQNQCKAAEFLGLSRGTLRKKLQQHGLL